MAPCPRSFTCRRPLAAGLAWLAVLSSAAGCSPYRAIPLTRLEIPREVSPRGGERPRIRYRIEGAEGWINMEVRRIDAPFLSGRETAGDPPAPTAREVMIDARTITELQVYSEEGRVWSRIGTVTGALAGVAAGLGLVVGLVALATKTSCPFVFVETPEGPRLVGEGYSGATVRSIQRDDLLELPPLSGATARLALSNHAFETQRTDRLELQLVEHAPDERVVAGADARPLRVGAARPPARVATLDGRAVPSPTSEDGRLWESDMGAAARAADPPLRDGLEVTFAPSTDGAAPVLELDVANTPWIDVVLGRMFAAFGDGLEAYLAEQESPSLAPAQRAWREREGVDLAVEVPDGAGWRPVARVPTPGPAAVRHVGVVLPQVRAGEPVRVRLVAGTGFWRVGTLGLSALRDGAPPLARVAPSRAVQPDGTDGRAQLAETDGVYQVLARRGDRLALEFDLPPVPAGRAHTAFLFVNGYYSVHPPPQASRSVGTLLRLRDEPGAMARFGVDLYRVLERTVRDAPREAPP